MPVGTYDGVRYSVKLAEHVDPLPPRESPRSVSEAPEKLHLATTPKAPRKPVNTPATDPAASADAEKVLGTRVIRNQPREIRDQNFNTISTQQPLVSSMASSKGVAAKDNSAGRSDAANSDGMVNGAPRLQVGPPSDHRDLDEIRRVFERNKWPLAVLYDYAVREHPSMGVGRIVVRLTVAPGGAVVDCLLVSSTFAAPDFERRIVSQIRLFRFPSENAFQFTFPAYPIDFQPE